MGTEKVDFRPAARFNIDMRTQRAATWSLFLSVGGIGLAGYLTVLHLGLLRGELLGGAVCGTSGAFNCHLVAGSTWSSFLGLPLSLWGALGYIGIFALSLLARQSTEWATHAMTLIVGLATVFVTIDVLLLGVMVFVIHALCLFCLATYLVNLIILLLGVRSLGRSWPETLKHVGTSLGALVPSSQHPAAWLVWGTIAIGVLGVSGLHAATLFVSRGTLGSVQRQIREYLEKQTRVSVDVTGDPMIGQPTARLQIVEFSDFFCPACQRASKLNPIIVANHRHDAVFIFKHFPLDTSCNDQISHMVHPGACQIAAASECANLQGKFWPFHDLIFEKGHDYNMASLEGDVQRLGLDVAQLNACMASGQGMAAVKRDIAEGAKVNVSSTPTYIIDGTPLPGMMTPAMFDDIAAVLKDLGR